MKVEATVEHPQCTRFDNDVCAPTRGSNDATPRHFGCAGWCTMRCMTRFHAKMFRLFLKLWESLTRWLSTLPIRLKFPRRVREKRRERMKRFGLFSIPVGEMRIILTLVLLLLATPACPQTPTPSAGVNITRIQRVCPNVSATVSGETLLAAVADCLDRLSPPSGPSPSGISLESSGIGELRVREFRGQKVFYPNPSLTPGKLSTRDTVTVCDPNFRTSSVRHDTTAMKAKVYEAYGLDPHAAPCPCEIDHWFSFEDGGVDGSETLDHPTPNLWPQPYAEPFGAHDKDRVESWIHKELCAGSITREQVPDVMARWPDIYEALKSGRDPLAVIKVRAAAA